MPVERLSIEVTNRCGKACAFCYSHSLPTGNTSWTTDELVAFIEDCARHGVKAVSFGGGEPLEFDGIFNLLHRLRGVLFRSMTTNGLRLTDDVRDALIAAAPDKVHVSIHFPENEPEVSRVIGQVIELDRSGIRSGINLLVARSKLAAARSAAQRIQAAGIDNRRVVYLPMRGSDTPTPSEVASIAGGPFQSMSCLAACANSPRFCSVSWDRKVGWCSYTRARRELSALTYNGLQNALNGLGLEFCGGTHAA
ncbi:MAG TPA: radical SAM protein [Humisphaera sp.]|nr:radical SAM protein [Humisphaera sp.]